MTVRIITKLPHGTRDIVERVVLRPGMKVWAKTTSGQPILCTIIEPDPIIKGEWVLDSPAHGYAIHRHPSELEPI